MIAFAVTWLCSIAYVLHGPAYLKHEIAALVILVSGQVFSYELILVRLVMAVLHFFVGIKLLIIPRNGYNLASLFSAVFDYSFGSVGQKDVAMNVQLLKKRLMLTALSYGIVDVFLSLYRLEILPIPSEEMPFWYNWLTYHIYGECLMVGIFLIVCIVELGFNTASFLSERLFNFSLGFLSADGLFGVPIKSRSPREFWSKNWHQMFRPIFTQVSQVDTKKPEKPKVLLKHELYKKSWDVFKVFLFSGVFHEYVLAAITHVVTFEQVLFFVLNGLLVVVELYMCVHHQHFLNRVPTIAKQVWTTFIITWTSQFFFAPYVRMGIMKQTFIPVSFAEKAIS